VILTARATADTLRAMFDPGPPPAFAAHFAKVPDHEKVKHHFWHGWGPIFYRGPLDGSARVLCVASDPGPTERIAGRNLVGDAGQKVQGFLAKIGLTRSYLCLNAFVYALYPSHSSYAWGMLKDPEFLAWRNELYDLARGPDVVAVVGFGQIAQRAVDLWDGKDGLEVFEVPHPSSHDDAKLRSEWRKAVTKLRKIVDPDPDGSPRDWNYGDEWRSRDWKPVPARDLPFGVPAWIGDAEWCRESTPSYRNCVYRHPDDPMSLVWTAPGD